MNLLKTLNKRTKLTSLTTGAICIILVAGSVLFKWPDWLFMVGVVLFPLNLLSFIGVYIFCSKMTKFIEKSNEEQRKQAEKDGGDFVELTSEQYLELMKTGGVKAKEGINPLVIEPLFKKKSKIRKTAVGDFINKKIL